VIASDDMMELSENLQAVDVKTISNAQCEASSGRVNGQWDSYQNQIYDAMLCAADDNQDAVSLLDDFCSRLLIVLLMFLLMRF
jgi:hypothetical protein